MIHLVAKVVVEEGKVEAFLELAKELVVASRKEAGCLSYALNKDLFEGNVFYFTEDWQDKAALEEHHHAEHFERLFPQIKEMLTDKASAKMTPLDF